MTTICDGDGIVADTNPVVAGVGFSSKANSGDIVLAVREALRCQDCAPQDCASQKCVPSRLVALASVTAKRNSAPLRDAARELRVELILIDEDAALSASRRGMTRSEISVTTTGLPSVSEAAALAAAGPQSRLLAPRICHGPVTCALAVGAPESLLEQRLSAINERAES